MYVKTGALVRRGATALTAVAAVAAGVAVATPAYAVLPLPTITSVAVAGSTNNKVVTAGTSIVITGTGFSGMTDNNASTNNNIGTPVACNVAAAYPATGSGCSQVRFLGVGATTTQYFTLATRYNVVSDTTIYATVPTISANDGVNGGPAGGTGSIKVQVLNTIGTGTSSLLSASTASELFYRRPLTATIATTAANPVGGGVVPVTVGGGIASMTNAAAFTAEKITAYVYSTFGTSPQVGSAAVSWKDTTSVNVTLPPGGPSGDPVGVMLVHDGIPGTADATHVKYPAVINKIETCTTDVLAFATTLPTTLPTTCTGPANAPGTAASNIDVKVTGKGFAGATAWDWDGALTTSVSVGVESTCTVLSDTLAYCDLIVHTVPSPPVVAVTFTPLDPDSGGAAIAPDLAPTSGGIMIYSTLV